MSNEEIQAFLDILTALSHRYGLAINSDGDLFEIKPEDADRRYYCDEDSKIDCH